MKRSVFTTTFSRIAIAVILATIAACTTPEKKEETSEVNMKNEPFFKLSLAQWSLHRAIYDGEMSPLDFAQRASELGFEGIEYVSGLYSSELEKDEDPQAAMQNLLETLKSKSEEHNVQNVLIMVDGEGELASPDESIQNQAVENHKKWVDAAAFLGCHSIRVNLFGTDDPEVWKTSAATGLTKLAEYGSTKNINIIVENHGSFSSNGAMLAEVMKSANKPNCGTLPDFGNFCLTRKDGKCVDEYDKYKGIEEMMPFAKAVSAKSYDFDDQGEETVIDYRRMLKIVKNAGYTGFIGVEYEGSRISEEEGTIATKDLLLTIGKEMSQSESGSSGKQ